MALFDNIYNCKTSKNVESPRTAEDLSEQHDQAEINPKSPIFPRVHWSRASMPSFVSLPPSNTPLHLQHRTRKQATAFWQRLSSQFERRACILMAMLNFKAREPWKTA